jgi:hypothetical protein
MHVSKKTKIAVICVVVIVAILGTMRIVSSIINTPSQGIIYAPNNSQPVQSSINLAPKLLTGKYATFNHPTGLTQVANNKIVTPVVATYNFSYRDIETWDLAIDIILVPSGKLTDNSSYQVREINPATYQQSQLNLNNHIITVMTDRSASGYSKVAFLVHGQYQATISLYGDDASGFKYLDLTLNMVLSSWHWQQSQ